MKHPKRMAKQKSSLKQVIVFCPCLSRQALKIWKGILESLCFIVQLMVIDPLAFTRWNNAKHNQF